MKIAEKMFKVTLSMFVLIMIISLLFSIPYVKTLRAITKSDIETEFNQQTTSNEVVKYMNYRRDTLIDLTDSSGDEPLFTQEEITHLEDVKTVLENVRMLSILCLFTAVSLYFYIRSKKREVLPQLLKNIVVFPTYITLLLLGFAIVDFKSLFNLMHNILFNNNNWLLTNEHVLIILYPESFWVISIVTILILWLGILFALQQFNKKYLFRKITE